MGRPLGAQSFEFVRWITGAAALTMTVVIVVVIGFVTANRVGAEPPVTDCTTSGIQAALSAGGMVTFNCPGSPITIPITATLAVTQSLTLDGGNQVTLDGQGARRILSVSAGVAITVTNIILQNGRDADGFGGGAVLGWAGSMVVISGTTLRSNTAGGVGGGVSADHVTIIGSTVLSNTATSGGGGIGAYHLTIVRGTLASNSAPFGSGGAALANYLTATGTTILSNSANGLGGGLGASFRASVVDSIIQNNRSSTSIGGGLWASTATISGTTIVSNSAGTFGGGVFAVQTLTVTGSTFDRNTAQFGGGINADRLIVTSTMFSRNAATAGSGGGAHTNDLTASAVTVLSNTATPGGGAGLAAIMTATVQGSTFQHNQATSLGGGLWGGTASVGTSTFISNAAANGGGIGTDTNAFVMSSTMISNRATNGGAVAAAGTATVTSTTMMSNTALTYGGGISSTAATIAGSTFVSNNAGVWGGMILALNASIADTTIVSNTADAAGGAVALYQAGIIERSQFRGNRSGVGAAISVFTAVLTSTLVEDNHARDSAGGINASNALLVQTVLTGNSASYGAGVAANFVRVDRSTLAGNRAITFTGGAIYGLHVQLTNATIYGNSSPVGGGAVSVLGSLAMMNTTALNNGAFAITSTVGTKPFTLTDSLLGGPGTPICSHPATLQGNNLLDETSCGNLINTTLLVGPLQDNGGPTWTMAPLAGSPAINGVASCLVAIDQRGAARSAPTCDVGAYETGVAPLLTSLAPVTVTALDPTFTLSVHGSGFLPGTVALWNGAPRPTSVVNTTTLTINVPAADLLTSTTVTIQARYGLAQDGVSNGLPFTITKVAQSINFGPLPDRTLIQSPFVISGTASSGLPVSFAAGGLCSLVGTSVTLTATGLCTITATQAGDATYLAAPPVVRSFVVSKAGQSITFASLPDRTLADPPFPVSATASSGLAVQFAASGACSISGPIVTLLTIGTCTITAFQTGSAVYEAATPVERSFSVGPAPLPFIRVVTLPAIGKNRTIG